MPRRRAASLWPKILTLAAIVPTMARRLAPGRVCAYAARAGSAGDQPTPNHGVHMRKRVLLLAVAIAATAPSLASARTRHHAPPPPPVDQNAAGAHFVSEGLRNFLIVPVQSVLAPAPAPEPVYPHRHRKHA